MIDPNFLAAVAIIVAAYALLKFLDFLDGRR